MSDKSGIEWTDATWNPIVGCSIVSAACTNCYAMPMAARLERMMPTARRGDAISPSHYAALTTSSKAGPVWTGRVTLAPDHILTKPLRWKKPRKIFVNSMGDLFHESVPDEWIDRVFAVMALAPQHTFQILTKRSKRMWMYLKTSLRRDAWAMAADPMGDFAPLSPQEYSNRSHFRVSVPTLECFRWESVFSQWPLPNVWLGVTAEDQTRANERIPDLLDTPAAKRFVSIEPMLGPIDLTFLPQPDDGAGPWWVNALDVEVAGWFHDEAATIPMGDSQARADMGALDWVIAGGESGPKARPSHPDWFRSLRDQCAAAGVPFFFKQWGEFLPVGQIMPGYGKVHGATAVKPGRMKLHYGGTPKQPPKHAFAERGVEVDLTADGRFTFRVGKRFAGSLLDRVEHKAFPV